MTNTISVLPNVISGPASSLKTDANSQAATIPFSQMLANEMQLQEAIPMTTSTPLPVLDEMTASIALDDLGDLDASQVVESSVVAEQLTASMATILPMTKLSVSPNPTPVNSELLTKAITDTPTQNNTSALMATLTEIFSSDVMTENMTLSEIETTRIINEAKLANIKQFIQDSSADGELEAPNFALNSVAAANNLGVITGEASSHLSTQTITAPTPALNDVQQNNIAPALVVPMTDVAADAVEQIIAPRVGTPNWEQAIGQKLNWMTMGGVQSASLILNPPELGPLQVVIHVNNQHADATFISHQPEVRNAIENALPKLREIMDQSGIQLGECNVNSQTKQQQEFAERQSGAFQTGSHKGVTIDLVSVPQPAVMRSSVGLVDTFV